MFEQYYQYFNYVIKMPNNYFLCCINMLFFKCVWSYIFNLLFFT